MQLQGSMHEPIILACTDFTPYSDHALRAAEALRKKTNVKLHVLHVSVLPVLWDWVPEGGTPALLDEHFELELLKSLKKKMLAQIAQCGVQGEAYVSLGLAHARIAAEAVAFKADLIVVGHKGKTGGLFRIGS